MSRWPNPIQNPDLALDMGLPELPPPPTWWAMGGHTYRVSAVVFFKNGRRVVTGSWDHTLRIWDAEKEELAGRPLEGHNAWVRSVAVSPDSRRIASGGDDNNIIIWDVEKEQKVYHPMVKYYNTSWVVSLCFSPDGKRLASGLKDEMVIIRDADTGTILSTFGHRGWVYSVAFSPDGQKLASGSGDRTIRIWRPDTAELLVEINTPEIPSRNIVWSYDGQQLVSVSDLKTVRFWNSSDGDQIGKPCIASDGRIHYINSLAISSDGSFIVTSSDDKTVRLWSTKTHQQIGQALEHTAEIFSLAISPNGELLVGGDSLGAVRPWSIKDIPEQHNAEESGEEAQSRRQRPLQSHSDAQGHSRDNDGEPAGNHDSPSNYPSETDEALETGRPLENDGASDNDDKHSLFDILQVINNTAGKACITGDLHTAEELLTQEIDADGNYDSYASRSVVRARNSEWENALQDAVKSIAIQPSLLGYISKGIALCGNERLWDAMEAFDLAFIFLNQDSITIDLLLLIKAVALFNASRHDEAMRRVQDFATACHHLDTYLCNVVDSYLRVQLAMITFENGHYIEAADQLTTSITTITGLFLPTKLLEPRLKIFTLLFGWNFDSLRQTVNQRRCDAFLRADRVIEAAESLRHMMSIIDESEKESCLNWSTAFKEDCTARCVAKGDKAVAAGNYEIANELYSAAIGLDSSSQFLFLYRSKAKLGRNRYAEALHDAEKAIELNPSSYLGYELKHAVLHGARRYDEAIEAFKTMLSKLDDAPDEQLQELRQRYLSQPEAEEGIGRAIHAHMENVPLRLLNTSTGRLCSREAQIKAFRESTEYKELLSSSMTHPRLQTELIQEAVTKYFSWVMLSHRWESKEPLLHDIQDKDVYGLDPVGTTVKLQMFCKMARNAGYLWAWSDTCCIDQNNNVELQRSVNSMFVWYRQSALTIVYLSDVPPSAKSGALANSVWNTRGWTVQEFLAPNVVLFYQQDWTLYLNDRSPNHKQSVAIMQELERSTGINAQALIAFRPGMTGAREKLQWASTRVTTLQEDIAYSLFGIFRVHLPVIYGETKQNALGRLVQEIVARSGDITALDWVGKSSEFNSCLPADITSYKTPPCTLPSLLLEDEMQMSVSRLRNTVALESASKLYTLLYNISTPRFANSRLQLPCIAFPVTAVRRNRDQDRDINVLYEVKADGLQDLLITTTDKLTQFSRARSTRQPFLLVRPWNRYDLELLDLADDAQSVDEWSDPESPSDESLSRSPGDNELPDMESHTRELRLLVRLGQPFGALLLAQQRGGEYKRIASDHNIIARVKDMTAADDMMDVRALEIL